MVMAAMGETCVCGGRKFSLLPWETVSNVLLNNELVRESISAFMVSPVSMESSESILVPRSPVSINCSESVLLTLVKGGAIVTPVMAAEVWRILEVAVEDGVCWRCARLASDWG